MMHLNLRPLDVNLNYTILHHFYLQHLYFNDKTSSAHSSSINASESLSDGSSLRIEFKMSFDWSSYWSVFPRGYLTSSVFLLKISMTRLSFHCTVTKKSWEVCIAANSRKIKLGAHQVVFETIRVTLMYVNLTFGKFALILYNVNFLRVVNVHR